jgi:hypothetical protein
MDLIARSASKEIEDKLLFCTQKSFNNAIEVAIKMIDRLDRYDRMFSQE